MPLCFTEIEEEESHRKRGPMYCKSKDPAITNTTAMHFSPPSVVSEQNYTLYHMHTLSHMLLIVISPFTCLRRSVGCCCRWWRRNNAHILQLFFLSNGSPGCLPLRAFMCSQPVCLSLQDMMGYISSYLLSRRQSPLCLSVCLSASLSVAHFPYICHVTSSVHVQDLSVSDNRSVLWYTGTVGVNVPIHHRSRSGYLIPVAIPCVPIDTIVPRWEASEGS